MKNKSNQEATIDVVIIGAGPVGLFSVFSCAMMGLSCHVIETLPVIGGQCRMLYPEKPIHNLPGFPVISGKELIDKLQAQIEPYAPVKVSAALDFYSALTSYISASSSSPTDLSYWKNQYAHGIRSYVLGTPSNVNNTLTVAYSVAAERRPIYLAGETTPTRVTKEAVEVNMSIRGDNIGNLLLISGNHAEITCHLLDMNTNTTLDKLRCSGQITRQELSVSSQNYLNGVISVRQVFQ